VVLRRGQNGGIMGENESVSIRQVLRLASNSRGEKLTIEQLQDGRYELEMIDDDNYQQRMFLSEADVDLFIMTVAGIKP